MVKNASKIDSKTLRQKADNQAVETRYNRLKEKIFQDINEENKQAEIEKAFELAQTGHKNTYRKSGEPYIMHPLRVAEILLEEIGPDTTCILSGLLHDLVEDTRVSINQIKEIFGGEVAKIVYGLTKIKKIFLKESSEYAENLRKLLLSLINDHRIILVKLADRLDNMRTLNALPRRKQLKIASETIRFYVPIAHRLGLNKIKLELEDLYLKHIYPNIYDGLTKSVRAARKVYENLIDEFAKPIEKALHQKKIDFTLKNRTKSIYSIWRKIKKNNIEFNEVYDLIALRIIVNCSIEEEKIVCWKILGIITSLYTPHPKRLRDWISIPKSNGYESLHVTVMNSEGKWIEVQIRTARMDQVACEGLAAHWRYKKEKSISNMPWVEIWMKNVQQILKDQKRSSIEAIEDVKLGFFEDEINIFTKKGSVKILPEGATVLDFAIEEKDIEGLQCSGALVNQKIVPLHKKLQNGDYVELITNEEQTPKSAWLDFVITPKARRVIRKAFKSEYASIQKKGEVLVAATLNKLGIDLNKKTDELLREFFDENTIDDLYYKLGSKKIQPEALEAFTNFVKEIEQKALLNHKSTNHKHIEKKLKEKGIMVNAREQKYYKLAECCEPIFGEEIFGVLGLHEKVKVHRVDCPNANYILTHQGSKIIKAGWHEQDRGTLVNLAITALYQEGVRKNIMSNLQAHYRIESILFKKQKDFVKVELTIEVKDATQLNQVIHLLKHIQGVADIVRKPRKT